MLKAYKYRIYPTAKQVTVLEATLDKCRFLYNCALEQRIRAYKKGHTLSNYQQQKELSALKAELSEFNEVYSHVLQDVLSRLDKAYKAFFSRIKRGDKAGFPRFQGRHRYNSFHYKEYKQTPTEKSVYLPKIGNVRTNLHRPVEGKIKTATIKRDSCGDWFVTFACEVQAEPLPKTGSSVGIDRGISVAFATSDGHLEPNPKHVSKAEKALRKAQRRLAKREKGSKRREKARLAVAKIYRKVQRQRADFLHKISHNLVLQYDYIVFENLNVKGMVRSNLAKSILDVGWSQLQNYTSYKAEYAGKFVEVVRPHYSSQECAACGHISPKNRVSQSKFKCANCKRVEHADINAAQVIRGRGSLPPCVNRKPVGYAVA